MRKVQEALWFGYISNKVREQFSSTLETYVAMRIQLELEGTWFEIKKSKT